MNNLKKLQTSLYTEIELLLNGVKDFASDSKKKISEIDDKFDRMHECIFLLRISMDGENTNYEEFYARLKSVSSKSDSNPLFKNAFTLLQQLMEQKQN